MLEVILIAIAALVIRGAYRSAKGWDDRFDPPTGAWA
jgi:hypothetical protein